MSYILYFNVIGIYEIVPDICRLCEKDSLELNNTDSKTILI